MQKRYQHWTKNGIEWTQWFNRIFNKSQEPWQLKNKLKNEYRAEMAE